MASIKFYLKKNPSLYVRFSNGHMFNISEKIKKDKLFNFREELQQKRLNFQKDQRQKEENINRQESQLNQREKQIQQSYRPIIGVHKWFARRPGALFRALLLAEFTNTESLEETYRRLKQAWQNQQNEEY